MTMNVLFVYSPAKFKIEGRIEFLRKEKTTGVIEPGELVLAPGVYRFAGGVGVTPLRELNGTAGDTQMFAVPDEKSPWPDPPLIGKLNRVLGVTRADLVDFLGGAGVQDDLS